MTTPIKPPQDSIKVAQGRIRALMALTVLGFSIIALKYAYLQIIEHEHFQQRAWQNYLHIDKVQADRGRIFDRHGVLLAEDQITQALYWQKNQQSSSDILQQLQPYIEDYFDAAAFHKRYQQASIDSSVLITRHIPQEALSELWLHQHQWPPELHLINEKNRHYPFGHLFSHIVGSSQGQSSGIEKQLDSLLTGHAGIAKVAKTAQGHILDRQLISESEHGQDVMLTVDARLQQTLHNLMQDHKGAAMVVDSHSGEILAAVSMPTFNPNQRHFAEKDQQSHFNRLTHGMYPPASTVKPFIGLYALEHNWVSAKDSIDDPGYYDVPGTSHRYHDWQRSGHGRVNMQKAIRVSCDTYFYHLAEKMGAEAIFDALQSFGLGLKTHVELPGEKDGLIPNITWKRHQGKRWYLGDTINTAIGQGDTMVTPLQLARATLLMANQGQAPMLHLVKATRQEDDWQTLIPQDQVPVMADKKNWKIINQGLIDVIRTGTGHRFGDNPYQAAGKTGTAQVISLKQAQKDNWRHHDHSLFIGYAPHEAPSIVVVVILEHHHLAVQVANDIINDYFSEHQHESDRPT